VRTPANASGASAWDRLVFAGEMRLVWCFMSTPWVRVSPCRRQEGVCRPNVEETCAHTSLSDTLTGPRSRFQGDLGGRRAEGGIPASRLSCQPVRRSC
jgi:hypothetical protein